MGYLKFSIRTWTANSPSPLMYLPILFHRLSRDEKLYQKELEAALKASIIESQQSSADNESSSTANNDEEDISDEEDRVESKRKKARLLPCSDVEDNNNKENTELVSFV